ncbi:hypothetical protein ACH429_04380 [Streptomyces pathocidini]|uniref:Uncharacterized protein n=1 Tax=Streptomyces pathocidini TaxID=1650571 RepID=A0ABW7UL20_9ACTN|nr:hypothetical protein [Streptomyces pathocidini]
MARSCASDGTVHALFTCMTVSGGGTADGTRLEIRTCGSGSASQQRSFPA